MKKIVLGLSALCLLMACGSSEQPLSRQVARNCPLPVNGMWQFRATCRDKGFRRNIDA